MFPLTRSLTLAAAGAIVALTVASFPLGVHRLTN